MPNTCTPHTYAHMHRCTSFSFCHPPNQNAPSRSFYSFHLFTPFCYLLSKSWQSDLQNVNTTMHLYEKAIQRFSISIRLRSKVLNKIYNPLYFLDLESKTMTHKLHTFTPLFFNRFLLEYNLT